MKKLPNNLTETAKQMRRVSREVQLASGIKPRAQTFADRKKVASKRACRGYRHAE